MSEKQAEKVIIIGSGPAAWSAAIYAARANLQPLVLEGSYSEENRLANNLPMGQLYTTTEVENYPGYPKGKLGDYLQSAISEDRFFMLPPHSEQTGITGPELVELQRQQAINFGTRVVSVEAVDLKIDQKPYTIIDNEGGHHETKSVIIATGAKANWLGLPNEDLYKNHGLSACAVCDGALPRYRNQTLVVIGGGDSAIEEADYLTNFASKVYLVHRRNEFRASKFMVDRAQKNPKIEILFCRIPVEYLGNQDKGLTGVKLQSVIGEPDMVIQCPGVFCAIGHTPNTAFLAGKVDLTDKKYVKRTVPYRTNTSIEGIFAAGDCADDYYRQAITSAGTGAMAALDAERYLAALN